MNIKKIMPLLILNVLSFNVYADDSRSCYQTAMNQTQLNQCAGMEYEDADKELNRVYKKVRVLYKDDKLFLQKLKKSQLAWIKLRDADFEMMYPHHNDSSAYGSVFPMCSSMYLAKLTMERVAYLKTWLSGADEGDTCRGSQMTDYDIQDLMKK